MSDSPTQPTSTESVDSALVDRVATVHRQEAHRIGIRLFRAWNILKYYGKSQLARRAISRVGNRIGLDSKSRTAKSLSAAAESLDVKTQAKSAFELIRQIRVATSHRNAKDVREQLGNGEVSVLNLQRQLKWRVDDGASQTDNNGSSKNGSLLWQFQLHYHEYLLPLACDSPNPNDLQILSQTIVSWIDENPISDPATHLDAWHPYCISRRLPVWFCLLTVPELGDSIRERMLVSAQLQAEFLSRNLEWDLRGNHLLENLRALALAGCFFDSEQSRHWLSQVRRVLPTQIKQQVLAHGEHYERCPMYHCQVFGNFLETLIVCQNVDADLYNLIRPVAEKMFGFLAEIVHPDGEIPLLGDSCFGEAPNVRYLERLAEAAALDCPAPSRQTSGEVTTVGDYWIFRDQNDYLLFDRGPAGADTLPAHAHCDLLTLESSIGGVRWLVDSGLYGYDDDPMRWYCRSSLAHNVVCVDDQNQFDIWSKFRMGRRCRPVDLAHGRENEFNWATASHHAYRRLGVEKLSRLIGIQTNRFWYCLDRVEKSATVSSNRLTGFMHLSPDVTVLQIDETQYRIDFAEHSCNLTFFGTHEVDIVESWYCPEFGLRIRNLVFEYGFDPAANLTGWLLIPNKTGNIVDDNQRLTMNSDAHNDSIQITISNHTDVVIHTFDWKTTE